MLREKSIEADEINYAKEKLDAKTIKAIIKAVGSVAAVLNTRHALVKERDWIAKPPSADELANEAERDPNLLRRPIFIDGKTVVVGFQKANQGDWEKLA